MMAAWMAYTVAVSLLAALAATGIESALRLFRVPARWVWAGAMAVSLGLPLWAQFRSTPPVSDQPTVGAFAIDAERLFEILGTGAGSAAAPTVDTVLTILWIVSSLLIAGVLVASQFSIRRDTRRWPVEHIDGVAVRLTPSLGPAVVGCFPSVIVLPAWVRRLDQDWQSLVVAHERQHLRAGDATLLFAGLVAATLVPWNIPLWWQLRRLRDAVELDCDERLVHAGTNVRAYSELLLEVARQGKRTLLAPALSNPKSLLARRIHMMTQKAPRALWPRAGLAAAVATVFIGLACETPMPAAVAFDEPGAQDDLLQPSHLVRAEGQRLLGAHLDAGPAVLVVAGRDHGHARNVQVELGEIGGGRQG